MAKIHPAIAGHAMEENEKLREALRWYEEKVAECRKIGSLGDNARQALDLDGGFRARDALSQQAEPAPAQDGREAPEVVAVLYKSGAALTAEECGIALEVCAKVETPLMTVAQHERIVASLTHPAQPEQQPIRLPERKRTDHLPKEYKTMTVVRAGLEAYNRALDDVAALNAAPAQVTAAMWKAAHDSMESDGDLALALQEALNAAHQQSAPQPEQSGLVEAASGALAAIQDALEDAYHNAYPECCGQAHLECCGSPLQAWSEADQKTMERFAPHEKALRAALSAQGESHE